MKMSNNSKNIAAKYTANLVQNNQYLIFGSGSTVNLVIDYLSKSHFKLEKLDVVSASTYTSERLMKYQINEISLEELKNKKLDTSLICIDGADQIKFDNGNNPVSILKGHGSALVREKILWAQSDMIFVVVDKNKLVDKITGFIPVEIIPIANELVIDKINLLYDDIEIKLQMNSLEEPLITDNHNYILEVHHQGRITDINKFHKQVKSLVGVVDTGIFGTTLINKCKFIIGYKDKVRVIG
ncbi:MAG: Ribose-5-phosphate isomerase A [Candidatus Heimdallarchaeota archaeon LC_2]|nr:MAG: Ribose-5-phosphate isomerase A [Candidatus Heimdallarchaeota archaeon LC_2]